jgi:hypothetical protein
MRTANDSIFPSFYILVSPKVSYVWTRDAGNVSFCCLKRVISRQLYLILNYFLRPNEKFSSCLLPTNNKSRIYAYRSYCLNNITIRASPMRQPLSTDARHDRRCRPWRAIFGFMVPRRILRTYVRTYVRRLCTYVRTRKIKLLLCIGTARTRPAWECNDTKQVTRWLSPTVRTQEPSASGLGNILFCIYPDVTSKW